MTGSRVLLAGGLLAALVLGGCAKGDNNSNGGAANTASAPSAAAKPEVQAAATAGSDEGATTPSARPWGLTEAQLIANTAMAREFAGRWCQPKNQPAAVRATVDALLAIAGERNCLVAGAVLSPLSSLDLSGSTSERKLYDLRPLSAFTNLKSLTLSYTRVGSLEELAPLTGLERLNLSHARMKSLKGLGYLQSLKVLDLSFAGIGMASLKSLKDAQALKSVSLEGNAFTNIPELPASLENLNLAGNLIGQAAPDLDGAGLERLDLSHNKLHDLRGLANLKNLKELGLAENDIPFYELKHLWELAKLEKLSLDQAVQTSGADLLTTLKTSAPKLEYASGILIPLDAE